MTAAEKDGLFRLACIFLHAPPKTVEQIDREEEAAIAAYEDEHPCPKHKIERETP